MHQLVVAIVRDEDVSAAVQTLTEAHFRVTRLSTSGGFLRRGNSTLLIGTERARVPSALRVLERVCRSRTEALAPSGWEVIAAPMPVAPVEVRAGGAIVFVLDVRAFLRL